MDKKGNLDLSDFREIELGGEIIMIEYFYELDMLVLVEKIEKNITIFTIDMKI